MSTVSQQVTGGGWTTSQLAGAALLEMPTASLQLHSDASDAEGPAERPRQPEETVRKRRPNPLVTKQMVTKEPV